MHSGGYSLTLQLLNTQEELLFEHANIHANDDNMLKQKSASNGTTADYQPHSILSLSKNVNC